VKLALAVAAAFFLQGCAVFKRQPRIESAGVTVTAQPDAGKPATLTTGKAGETLTLPARSVVTVTKFEAVPPILGTSAGLGSAAIPAKTETRIELAADSTWSKSSESVNAETGTVDTTVAKAKIAADERRPLLWTAIGCAALGILAIFLQYPSVAALCGLGAALAFAAWRLAELPAWMWAIPVVVGIGLYIGHEKGESAPKTP